MVEENIYNYLTEGSNAITDLVAAASIGYIDTPQDSEYPKVVFNIISRPPIYESTMQWQRWRFYVLSEDKFNCKEIADALESSLHRVYGYLDDRYFDFITLLDAAPIQQRDDSIYEMYLDFRVLYH